MVNKLLKEYVEAINSDMGYPEYMNNKSVRDSRKIDMRIQVNLLFEQLAKAEKYLKKDRLTEKEQLNYVKAMASASMNVRILFYSLGNAWHLSGFGGDYATFLEAMMKNEINDIRGTHIKVPHTEIRKYLDQAEYAHARAYL